MDGYYKTERVHGARWRWTHHSSRWAPLSAWSPRRCFAGAAGAALPRRRLGPSRKPPPPGGEPSEERDEQELLRELIRDDECLRERMPVPDESSDSLNDGRRLPVCDPEKEESLRLMNPPAPRPRLTGAGPASDSSRSGARRSSGIITGGSLSTILELSESVDGRLSEPVGVAAASASGTDFFGPPAGLGAALSGDTGADAPQPMSAQGRRRGVQSLAQEYMLFATYRLRPDV